jgi:hypothetical protein
MKSKIPVYFVILTAIAAACSKPIDLDLPDYSSKLVINGEANTENVFSFQVSRSLPIMQANDSSGYLLKNAKVSIYHGPTFLGDALYQGTAYVLNQKPLANEQYSVRVSSAGYNPASATFTIPKQLNMTTTYIDSIGLDNDGFKVSEITLSFTDDPGIKNYYRLLIRYYNSGTLIWTPLNFNSNDIVFLNNDKLNDGSYLFSDRTFSGRTKVLTFNIPFGLAMGTPKYEVSIKSFSEDYYNYLRQTDTYNQNGNGVSNDPIILRTNVTNGLGIIGGVSNVRDTIF